MILCRNYQEKLDGYLVQLGYISSYKPDRGVMDQIINSGKINVLSNPNLRSSITKLNSTIDEAASDSKYASENYTHNLFPYLAKYFPLANGDLVKPLFQDEVPFYAEPSVFEIDWEKIDLLEFQNTIWHHKHNVDFLIKKDFELKGKMEFVLTEIESSLSELENGE